MLTRIVLALAAGAMVAAVLGIATHVIGTYGTPGQTLNGGIYAGPCVVEFWGTPGAGCHGNG